MSARDHVGTGAAKLDPRCLWRTFLRSLCLQGSWNPQRMQNLGLLVTLLPWLRQAGLSHADGRRFCRRHYEYFNTNPYYANLVVGGLLRLEEENQRGDEDLLPILHGFKNTLGRSLAALGDQFFWLGLQPALLVLASLAAFWGVYTVSLGIIGAFAALQFVARLKALARGYALGLDIADLLAAPGWHRAILTAKRAGAFLTGVLAGSYAARLDIVLRENGDRRLLLCAALALGLSIAMRRRWPGEVKLLMLLPLAVLMTYL